MTADRLNLWEVAGVAGLILGVCCLALAWLGRWATKEIRAEAQERAEIDRRFFEIVQAESNQN